MRGTTFFYSVLCHRASLSSYYGLTQPAFPTDPVLLRGRSENRDFPQTSFESVRIVP